MANSKNFRPLVAGKKSPYFVELDSLRCLAIVAVLAVHFQPPNMSVWRWMSLGWIGVDLFFVISGYLITTILLSMRNNDHPYRTFYWRRAIRIFPIYYGYLILVALANHGWGFIALVKSGLFLGSIPLDSASTIVSRLFHHMSFAVTPLPTRDHLFADAGAGLAMVWSLSVEELFYLFWAPIVLRLSRRTIQRCALIPILICPILRGLAHTSKYPEYFRFIFRIDTLMFGSVVALLFAAIKDGKLSRKTMDAIITAALCVPPVILLPIAWLKVLHNIELRSTYSFAIAGYSLCALFFAGSVAWCIRHTNSPSFLPAMLRNPASTFIGRISYGMYLIHIYAFVAVLRLARHFLGPVWMPGIGVAVAAALFTVGLASISWHFIETPILGFKDRFFPFSRRQISVESTVLTAAAFTPAHAHATPVSVHPNIGTASPFTSAANSEANPAA